MQIDETPIRIAECPNEVNYCFVISSGPNEPYQGTVYVACNDRSHENILRILSGKTDMLGDWKLPGKLSVKYIVCDCFGGYQTAVNKIGEQGGFNLRLAFCLQHANRNIINALDGMGLSDFYLELTKKDFPKALDKLDEMAQKANLKLDEIDKAMLQIRYFIEAMYRVDRLLEPGDFKEDPKQYYKEKTGRFKWLLRSLFKSCKKAISKAPGLRVAQKNGHDRYSCPQAPAGSWIRSVIYLLNHEYGFWSAAEDLDVPLTNNLSERQLRHLILQRAAFIRGFETVDGARAYCDMLSVIKSARMNGVNEHEYLAWYIQSIKKEAEELRIDKKASQQMLNLIQPYIEDTSGMTEEELKKEKLEGRIYHSKTHCITDEVNYSRYDPVSYKELLKACSPPSGEDEQGPNLPSIRRRDSDRGGCVSFTG